MAPLPVSITPSIHDLTISSLELDSRSSPIDLPSYLSTLSLPELESLNNPPQPPTTPQTPNPNSLIKRSIITLPSSSSPSSSLLAPRTPQQQPPATTTPKPLSTTHSQHRGGASVPPTAINMKGIQALFAIIGAAFVLASIWFFFWAKNGGFRWRKGDWEDYKSTVLRRKGPDGKTLSNATKSTRLGGGSVVAGGYSDDGMTVTGTEMSYKTEASGVPIFVKAGEKEKAGKKKRKEKEGKALRGGGDAAAKKNKVHDKLRAQQKAERWEGGFDDDVRAYRHEKPARVGGLNRDSDAMFYGTDYSDTDPTGSGAGSFLGVGHQTSSASGNPPYHQRRESGRRDFSYSADTSFTAEPAPAPARPKRYSSPSKPATPPRSARYSVPGSYTEPLDFDAQSDSQGTKSYHHPIPGLSAGFRAEARNANANGRARRDSLDDSD